MSLKNAKHIEQYPTSIRHSQCYLTRKVSHLKEEQPESTDRSHDEANPPKSVRIHDILERSKRVRILWRLNSMNEASLCLCGLGNHWIQGRGGQHLRRVVDEVHRMQRRSINRFKVQALDSVVGVFVDVERLGATQHC